jgi:hypothetical protein
MAGLQALLDPRMAHCLRFHQLNHPAERPKLSNSALLLLLAAFQVKHFLGDFVFQNQYILANRRLWGHPGGLLHAGIHVALTLPILLLADIPWDVTCYILIGEFLFHYHLDWAKDRLNHAMGWTPANKQFWWLVGVDQGLHQLSYLVIAGIVAAY